MNESDFWEHLEFRVSREFAGMPQNHLRFLWCDGFTPVQDHLEGPSPRITGLAWICNGAKEVESEFTLFLNHPVASRAEIEWQSLLPAENVTRWLAVDLKGKRIQIEPLAAVAEQDHERSTSRI